MCESQYDIIPLAFCLCVCVLDGSTEPTRKWLLPVCQVIGWKVVKSAFRDCQTCKQGKSEGFTEREGITQERGGLAERTGKWRHHWVNPKYNKENKEKKELDELLWSPVFVLILTPALYLPLRVSVVWKHKHDAVTWAWVTHLLISSLTENKKYCQALNIKLLGLWIVKTFRTWILTWTKLFFSMWIWMVFNFPLPPNVKMSLCF